MRAFLCSLLMVTPLFGTDIVFDGVTDGGWTISNQPVDPPIPFSNVEGTGFTGIAFNDTVQGVAYYVAPQSFIDTLNDTLNFGFWIDNDNLDLVDEPAFTDLLVNGNRILLDVISEENTDQLQTIEVDLTDPAFDGIGTIDSLWIRSEFWSSGGERIESYLVSAPEPLACGLLLIGALGLVAWSRR